MWAASGDTPRHALLRKDLWGKSSSLPVYAGGTVVSDDSNWDAWAKGLLVAVLVVSALWMAALLPLGPELAINNDELTFLYEALRLPAEFRLSGYMHAPLLYELIALVEGSWYGVLRLAGGVSSPNEFLTQVLVAQPIHLLVCRSMVEVISLLLLVQVYRLGSLFGGRRTGALASLLCATNLTFVILASSCKEDALFLLLFITAMLWTWRLVERPHRWDAIKTGVAIGASIVAKYFGVFAMALSAVPLLAWRRDDSKRAVMAGSAMILSASVSVLVLMPFLITDGKSVASSVLQLGRGTAELPGGLALTDYLFVHLPNLVGWVILPAALVECGFRMIREPRGPLVVMVAPLLLLLFLGLRPGLSRAYYVFPVAICLFILASSLAMRILDGWPQSRFKVLAPLVIGVVALSDPVFSPGSVKYGLILTGPDTRLITRDFIDAHVAPGDCVALTHGVLGWNVWGPPLLPVDPPGGSGAFWTANRAAIERAGRPRYRVRIANKFTGFPADLTQGCDWLVSAKTSPSFSREFGTPEAFNWEEPPAGFQVVKVIPALPEQQTTAWPFIGPEDYDEIRKTSLGRLWKDRARGLTLVVYHRAALNELAAAAPPS